jgi:type I phosphodiesterase/nucleotide pyrophosphatase
MERSMPLDDIALSLQAFIDRLIRRMRLGHAPPRGRRRLLVVQIDGLPRSVLEQGLRDGRMPFLRRLLDRRGFVVHPINVGLPTSTPSFQLAAMYGVRPDIPGFHYHDKARHEDVYFPRAGDANYVEATQAGGRLGILSGGSSYGCVFAGGADNNLFNFSMIKRPTGAGVARALSAIVVLAWVVLKCLTLTLYELARSVVRLLADPVVETARGWKWLALKLGLSVWMRQLFTLAVSRDLYLGVPVVYVNYLDYDVFAHAYGPWHRRAFRSLSRIDRSLAQLWRVIRRVPEHGYDLYIVSDHGQTPTVAYTALNGGRRVERLLFDEFFDPSGVAEVSTATSGGRRLLQVVRTLRAQRRHGLFQRFFNYLERDFVAWLGDVRQTHERGGVRVVSAGPNAFVYFLDTPAPLTLPQIDERHPGVVDEISRSRGIGLVLARSDDGPVCIWRGKRYRLSEIAEGPFAGRDDVGLVADGIRDLMAMRCAGDLVLYGNGSADGDVSFIPEAGAHAGPSRDEMQTFLVTPPGVRIPTAVRHPVELYDVFIRYQRAGHRDTA